ncbi:hypothetical protein HMPREF9944_01602 [Segatella maculosa OT 289]|uniref:Uncharacterized protein n=1 Tax=Segatella maculosa OT 289 TaxID=999422 RepID=H1HN58_9BACT|nr:hypothetical protein HMPREF9944_01602 [Segatella maculosa OT 289]
MLFSVTKCSYSFPRAKVRSELLMNWRSYDVGICKSTFYVEYLLK